MYPVVFVRIALMIVVVMASIQARQIVIAFPVTTLEIVEMENIGKVFLIANAYVIT